MVLLMEMIIVRISSVLAGFIRLFADGTGTVTAPIIAGPGQQSLF